jgi:hypothetical protein
MLGTQRAAISTAAAALKHDGLIEYRRGKLIIQDNERMARRACECYSAIRAARERAFPGVRSAELPAETISPPPTRLARK